MNIYYLNHQTQLFLNMIHFSFIYEEYIFKNPSLLHEYGFSKNPGSSDEMKYNLLLNIVEPKSEYSEFDT